MIETVVLTVAENFQMIFWSCITVTMSYVGVKGMIVVFSIMELRHRSALEILEKRIELEKVRIEGNAHQGSEATC